MRSIAKVLVVMVALGVGTGVAAQSGTKERITLDLGGHAIEVFTYRPAGFRGDRMVIVLHGTLRNADEYRDHACALGDRTGMLVVAPRFDRERFPVRRYQRGGILAEDGSAAAAGERTYPLIRELALAIRARERAPTMPFWVLGHSAGGQFVARMAAFENSGAAGLVAANAGSHLFPTRDLPFPYGFGDLPAPLATDEVLRRYLAMPLTLYQGTADDAPDEYFETNEHASKQGGGRLQRGRECFRLAHELALRNGWAFRWRLVEAAGVGHDHTKMFDDVACETALFGEPMSWTHDELEFELRDLARAIRESWSYLELRESEGLVLDTLLKRAVAELRSVRTAADYRGVLVRFVAALHDGHGYVRLDDGAPPTPSMSFDVVDCREGVLVQTVHDPSAVAVEVGDLLLAVDDVPVAEWLRIAEAHTFGSTPGMRRRQALRSPIAPPRVSCTVSRDGVVVTLPADPSPLARARRRAERPQPSLTWPKPGVALWRIPTFAVDRWSDWLAAKPDERESFLAESRARIDATTAAIVAGDATTLILDLRGNSGGTDLLGIHLAECLLDGTFRYFLLSSKHGDEWRVPGGLVYGRRDRPHRYAGRVIALVDEDCFSTTDNLLRCLRDLHPNFTVVGRATGGGTGAPRVIAKLDPSGAEITLCTQRVQGPKGALIEGSGTTPDVVVVRARADWLDGRDPELEAALALVDRAGGK